MVCVAAHWPPRWIDALPSIGLVSRSGAVPRRLDENRGLQMRSRFHLHSAQPGKLLQRRCSCRQVPFHLGEPNAPSRPRQRCKYRCVRWNQGHDEANQEKIALDAQLAGGRFGFTILDPVAQSIFDRPKCRVPLEVTRTLAHAARTRRLTCQPRPPTIRGWRFRGTQRIYRIVRPDFASAARYSLRTTLGMAFHPLIVRGTLPIPRRV